MSRVMGIDPGFTGALCSMVGQEAIFIDMPIGVDRHNKNQLLPGVLAEVIRAQAPELIALEEVGSMPGNGVAGMFRFGQQHGIIIGVIAALGIPLLRVSPNKWKAAVGLRGAEKDEARIRALQLSPSLCSALSLKKHIGRADAYWLARYAQQQQIRGFSEP